MVMVNTVGHNVQLYNDVMCLCITTSLSVKPIASGSQRQRSWWRPRNHRERRLLIVLVVAAISLIVTLAVLAVFAGLSYK